MGDGRRKLLRDVRVGDEVISHTGRARRVLKVFEQGMLPTLRITTASGRETTAAPDHPFLTPHGFLRADQLRIGDALAEVVGACDSHETTMPLEGYRLMGYFVGDGSTTGSSAMVTCYDDIEGVDLEHCAEAMGFGLTRAKCNNGEKNSYRFRSRMGPGYPGVREWLKYHDMCCGSYEKRVPEAVFQASHKAIAHFIGAYFACDGSINRYGNSRHDACVEFYSVNRALLQDVQHLLLRLKIQSTLAVKRGRYKGQVHISWRLSLTSQDNVARFAATIPIFHAKAATMREWDLRRCAWDTPLVADRIVAIADVGQNRCRCISVAVDKTFTADDLVVHNSSLASVGFAVWLLGNWPDSYVGAVSHTAAFARDNIGAPARALFERVGKEYFGLEIDPRSDAGDRWNIKGRRGGFFSDGVGGQIEGRRIDWAILDDVIGSIADAQNARFRQQQWDWYQAQLYPRLAPRAAIVNTMSRWHLDDLAGRQIAAGEAGEGPKPVVLDLPAIALAPSAYRDGKDALGRKPGEPLWPEVRSLAFLESTRRAIGLRNFEARFQGRPRPAEGSIFKREWFQVYDRLGDTVQLRDRRGVPCAFYRLDQLYRFAMVDLASSDGRGDYTVVTSFGMGPKGELIVLDVFRGQVPATRHLELMWQAKTRLGLTRIGCEDVAYQAALVQAAIADGLPVVGIKRGRGESKFLRAQNAAVMYEQGMVWHPRAATWLGDFEAELEDFPTGAHDDQVDTIADAATAVLELKARGGAARVATGVRV